MEPASPAVGHEMDARPLVAVRDPTVLLLILAFCAIYALRPSSEVVASGGDFSPTAYLGHLWDVLATYASAVFAVLAAARIAPSHLAPRALVLVLAVVAGISFGSGLSTGWQAFFQAWESQRFNLLMRPLGFLGIGLLGVALFLLAERDAAARRALYDEVQRRMELERFTAEARMSVLQSQVEPHFLFNVLAHLRRLYATDPSMAHAMMADLVRYLGDARPALQHDAVPLHEDARLAQAYLNLQRIRMGRRLDFSVDIAPSVREARVPPMALTILVENAIEHGISPRPRGGAIVIRAAPGDAGVSVEVIDDGMGLASDFGTGVGLSNLRARLEALYGDSASLDLRTNEHGGVTATMLLGRDTRAAT